MCLKVERHGSKLTRKKEEAIAALLTEPTIAGAAKKAGISESSILRWLKDEEFQTEYRKARRESVSAAISLLQHASGQAVTTLVEVMLDPESSGSVKISAARTVLENSLKAIELEDLAQRIQALETAVEEEDAR